MNTIDLRKNSKFLIDETSQRLYSQNSHILTSNSCSNDEDEDDDWSEYEEPWENEEDWEDEIWDDEEDLEDDEI